MDLRRERRSPAVVSFALDVARTDAAKTVLARFHGSEDLETYGCNERMPRHASARWREIDGPTYEDVDSE